MGIKLHNTELRFRERITEKMQIDFGEIEELAEKVVTGDRRSLARSITLIESDRPDHQESARNLLRSLMPKTGKSLRIGISGAPGVFGATGQSIRIGVLEAVPLAVGLGVIETVIGTQVDDPSVSF